jgi:uncharacterized iron-regulated protein
MNPPKKNPSSPTIGKESLCPSKTLKRSNYFPMVLFLVPYLLLNMNVFSQQTNLETGYYVASTLQKISHKEIIDLFKNVDVLILGEEHDDNEGHKEKANLYQALSNLRPSLSLEMFETDQQLYLDEFSLGIFDGKQLAKETRTWNNFEKDYLPLLQIAKNFSLPILAANAPRRYTRVASRGGMNALVQLPALSKSFLPPLYLIKAYPQPEYEAKFSSIMGGHGGDGLKNIFLAQELWDTTMSHTIATHISATGNKVLHINGRFHSDDGLGVTHRLKKMGLRVLTISMFPIRKNGSEEEISKIADIIYISGDATQK